MSRKKAAVCSLQWYSMNRLCAGRLSIAVESFCRQFIVHCPLRLYLRRHATDPLGSDSLLFVMRHHSHSAVLLPVFLFPCRFFQSETQNAIAAAPGIGDHLRPG